MINSLILPFREISNPIIVNTTGYFSDSESVALILFANSQGKGYTRIHGIGDDKVSQNNVIKCYSTKVTIIHLEELHIPKKLNSIGISVYRCNDESEQNCNVIPPTCTNEIKTNGTANISLKPFDPTQPNSPEPLNIIPQIRSLSISWNPVTNIEIFAYGIKITLDGNEIISGFVPGNFANTIVPDLIPDRTYLVEVFALSHSNIRSISTLGQGTPTKLTTTIIQFVISDENGPIQNAPVFIDQKLEGNTDINGELIIKGLPSDPQGTTYSYLINKNGYNDKTGNILTFPNSIAVENVLLTKSTISSTMTTNMISRKNIILQEGTSQVTFFVTSKSGPTIGPISDAIIFIDNVRKGSTNTNGVLTITDISASSEGLPHEYLIIKQGFNNNSGTFFSFPGTNIVRNIITTKFTPGLGALIVHVFCDGGSCEGAYIGARGKVRGITGPDGTLLIEELPPLIGETVNAFKPLHFIGAALVDVLSSTTMDTPPITLINSPPNLGSLQFAVYNIVGDPITNAQINVGEIAIPARASTTAPDNVYLYDKLPLGEKYVYTVVIPGFDTVRGTLDIVQTPMGGGRNTTVIAYPIGQTPTVQGEIVTGSLRILPVDSSGNPLDIVLILIDGKYGNQVFVNGEVFYDNLSPGKHTYTARKEGFSDAEGEAIVTSGSVEDMTIVMAPIETTISTEDLHLDKSGNKISNEDIFLTIGTLGILYLLI